MIVFLGDIHFKTTTLYWQKACEDFLDWYKSWNYNSEENNLVLLGDIVDVAQNAGKVIDYLERLYNYSNFKTIHIVVGNHDQKIVQNQMQLAYEFYKQKDRVFIYDKVSEVTIDGVSGLMLPYYVGSNEYGLSMKDYYSNIYKDKSFKNDYDFVAGHICGEDASFPGAVDCISNLDLLSGRKVLGHIHTRTIDPNKYTGSIFAGKKNENDSTRSAIIYDKENWFEERLPIFTEFLTVTYPEPLPSSTALNPIYTILNCGSENVARQTYGDIFIKRVTSATIDFSTKSKTEIDRQTADVRDMDVKDLFTEFLKTPNFTLAAKTIEECKKALNL